MLNESDSHFNKHPAQTPGETWVLERAWIQKHAKIITGVSVTSEQLPPPIHLNPEQSSSRLPVTIGMGRSGKPQLPHVESWPQEHLPDSETTCHFCWCSYVARFSIQMNKVTDTKLGLGSCSAPCCPSDHETGFKSLGSRFLPQEWEGGGEAISATPASQVFAKQGSHQQ